MIQGRILRALVISYADRVAAFAMPLLMLRGASGEQVYVKIEYIIAISVVVATFADAGLRNYVLYHFGRTRDATQTTLLTARAAVFMFLLQMFLLGVFILVSRALFTVESHHADLWLGVLRGVALSIIGVSTQILIIHDQPLGGILLSLTSWLIGAIALTLPEGTPVETIVTVFFTASFLTVLGVPVLLWRLNGAKINAEGLIYLKDAISWGWPLLLAAAASIAIANLTRIYGISTFSIATASALVFWMRIFSIIQLSHRAAVTIVSRSIFISSQGPVISAQVLRTYLQALLPAVALAFAISLSAPALNLALGWDFPVLSYEITIMIGLYITLWCIGAFLELPLTRDGRVFMVLLASVIPSVLFIAFLLFWESPTVLLLVGAMLGSASLQVAILTITNLKNNRRNSDA